LRLISSIFSSTALLSLKFVSSAALLIFTFVSSTVLVSYSCLSSTVLVSFSFFSSIPFETFRFVSSTVLVSYSCLSSTALVSLARVSSTTLLSLICLSSISLVSYSCFSSDLRFNLSDKLIVEFSILSNHNLDYFSFNSSNWPSMLLIDAYLSSSFIILSLKVRILSLNPLTSFIFLSRLVKSILSTKSLFCCSLI